MVGFQRIVAQRSTLLSCALIGTLSSLPAAAGIVTTGNVIPSPAVGDPWNVGGTLAVGESANGTMSIDAGSDVTNTDGFVANLAGSSGTVTVSGTGSSWQSSGELRMGNVGSGTLNITSGGAVTVGGNARVGNSLGGVGVATVNGAGSTLTATNFVLVGREGTGTLNIQNGGVVSDLIGGVAIFELTTADATIDGVGSAWNNTSELQIADGGTGSLRILNGGVATSPQGYLGVSPDGVGTVTVSGMGSAWNGLVQMQVGYHGRGALNIENGGTVAGMHGYVGVLTDGRGVVSVTGGGSTWTNSGEVHVGYDGNGELNIRNGGAVTSATGFICTNAGSSGVATVEGIGAAWTNAGALTVGSAGTGTLHINQGGLVSVAALDGTGAVDFDGGTLRITAADSSGNPLTLNAGGGTFDVSTAATTATITSALAGAGGLTKGGAGILELTAANTYSGDTRIQAGRLNISQPYLSSSADIYLASSASFGLNFPGIRDIDSIFINGSAGTVGTYGASGTGADFEMAIFSGTGRLRVGKKGLLGDYNDNGRVDAADYTVWRNRLGSATSLANDDTPGVGRDDYDRWTTKYGQVAGAGGVSLQSAGVPEPATSVLLELAVIGLMFVGPMRGLYRSLYLDKARSSQKTGG